MKKVRLKNYVVFTTLFLFSLSIISNVYARNNNNNTNLTIKTDENIKNEKPTNKQYSFFDIVNLENITKLVTLFGIIFALLIGYYALITGYVKDIIKSQDEKRKAIQKICHEQINKYKKNTNISLPIGENELQSLFFDAQSLDNECCSSKIEIASLGFLLKSFVQNIIKYQKHTVEVLTTNVYKIYVDILFDLEYLSLKSISFPSFKQLLFFTKTMNIINKRIKKFVLPENSNIKSLSFLETGIDLNPYNSIVLLFYSTINNAIMGSLVAKSAYRTINSHIPMIRILFFNGVYFPPVIKLKYQINFENIRLYLMKTQQHISLINGIKSIDYYYTINSDSIILNSSIINSESLSEFIDEFLNVEASQFHYISHSEPSENCIKICVSLENSKQYFKKYKKMIRRNMKKEIKDIEDMRFSV